MDKRTIIPDEGCVLDYTIHSKPQLKTGVFTRQYVLMQKGNVVEASEEENPS